MRQRVDTLHGIQSFNLVNAHHGIVETLLDNVQLQQVQVYAGLQDAVIGQSLKGIQQTLAGLTQQVQLDVDVRKG